MRARSLSRFFQKISARLIWLPLPVMAMALTLLWAADWRQSYESASVLMMMNVVFTSAVSVFIAILAGRTFLSTGQPGFLMLGCAMVFWGAAAFVATVGGQVGNHGITIHNTGVSFSALCHFAGVMLSRSKKSLRSPTPWLFFSYLGVLLVVGLIWLGTVEQWLPVFFLEGKGGTPFRTMVLSACVALFAIAAGLVGSRHLRQPSPFLACYAIGLALLAMGAWGLMVQVVHGSALGWTARAAQYIGGVYMLAGAISAMRQAQAWELALPVEEMEADTFRKALHGVFLWPLGAGLVLLLLFVGLLNYLLDSARWVDHTNQVTAQINRVEKLSVDLETGLRGFQVTGDKIFLQPFARARAALPQEFETLRTLIRDNPAQVSILQKLLPAHAAWMAYANDGRERVLARTRPDVTLELRGKALMDDFRRAISAMQDNEQMLLGQRTVVLQHLETASYVVIILLTLVLFPVLVLSLRRALLRVNTTYRHSLAEANRASERANNILGSIIDGFQTVDADWRLVSMNTMSRTILAAQGMDPDAVIGKTYFEIFPALIGTELEGVYRRVMAGRAPANLEYYYEPWRQWYDVRVFPDREGGFSIFFQDITARKQAEEKLRASEMRFRVAVRAVGNLIWTNNAEGKMEGEQPSWAAFTGQTREEYQGYGWAKALHPEDAQPTIDAWSLVVAEKQPFNFKHRVRRHDGAWRTCSVRALPIIGDDGQIQEWVGVHIDITEERAAADALAAAKERAEAASHAKDDFLAALSHELRTPLTPVLMIAAALREDERMPPDVREKLFMMERNIALEARLIDDLLDVTAIANGKLRLQLETCDTHSLINLAADIIREDAGLKKITVERHFHAEHSAIMADPARFQQIIWNLLRNSVKFTPPGGKISISTREEKKSGNETWLRIEIADNGIGIKPALLDQIFLPFNQGVNHDSHRFGGLGLGLTIARAVVELHGGHISAQSSGEDQGATFIVELPGALKPASGLAETGPAPTAGKGLSPAAVKPLRLLIVEDHEPTLASLRWLLERQGHHITTANTVASALAAAASGTFDLVISDLGLPDGTGNELMARLRDEHGLRGIALSGYGMEEDIARGRAAGFVNHLVKPVKIDDLRRVIAALKFPA